MRPGEETRTYAEAQRTVTVAKANALGNILAGTLAGVADDAMLYVDVNTLNDLLVLAGSKTTISSAGIPTCDHSTIKKMADRLGVHVAGIASPYPIWDLRPGMRGPELDKVLRIIEAQPKPERKVLYVDWSVVKPLLKERRMLERELAEAIYCQPKTVEWWHEMPIQPDHARQLARFFGVEVEAVTMERS